MTDHLKKIAGDSIPEKFKRSIATEKDITTIEELKTFIKKNRPPETL
jgi:CO dehydrogenase/acetyl-CoA synthase beta subunit